MKKKIVGCTAALCVLLSLFPAEAKNTVHYTDVSMTDWFYDAVGYVSDNAVMLGVDEGCFAPETELTRGMAVTVLSRIYGADISAYTSAPFTDVDMNKYYAVHIAWAKQNGVVHGMTETEFEPDEFITREQICVMLSNFFDFCKVTTRNMSVEAFSDEGRIAAWSRPSVIRLQRAGIVNGRDDNTFDPQGNTTRAEFAQIVYNTNLVKLLKNTSQNEI